MLRVDASIWGDPDDTNPDSTLKTWDSTAVFRERAPAVLNSLPLILDDTKLANKQNGDVATTIYSIAYGASVFPLLTCLTDILPQPGYLIPLISSCTTMQNIASDSSKFYAINFNGSGCASRNTPSSLNAVFSAIAADIGAPRLLPNGSA